MFYNDPEVMCSSPGKVELGGVYSPSKSDLNQILRLTLQECQVKITVGGLEVMGVNLSRVKT